MSTLTRSRFGCSSFLTPFLTAALVLVFLVLSVSQQANALPAFRPEVWAALLGLS
jgi:hypothetical protein